MLATGRDTNNLQVEGSHNAFGIRQTQKQGASRMACLRSHVREADFAIGSGRILSPGVRTSNNGSPSWGTLHPAATSRVTSKRQQSNWGISIRPSQRCVAATDGRREGSDWLQETLTTSMSAARTGEPSSQIAKHNADTVMLQSSSSNVDRNGESRTCISAFT